MTVKELKNILDKYNDDAFVRVVGGECASGEWAQLEVGQYAQYSYIDYEGNRQFYQDFDGDVILDG